MADRANTNSNVIAILTRYHRDFAPSVVLAPNSAASNSRVECLVLDEFEAETEVHVHDAVDVGRIPRYERVDADHHTGAIIKCRSERVCIDRSMACNVPAFTVFCYVRMRVSLHSMLLARGRATRTGSLCC